MSEAIIVVERLTKQVRDSTGTLTILHEIDFSLAARHSAAIVGASGSGKSTLLSLIAGLDTTDLGNRAARRRRPVLARRGRARRGACLLRWGSCSRVSSCWAI
jgi:predicted ABC-type transport system involved in lysophospholipase L1 biosynthesis ATPase subunit